MANVGIHPAPVTDPAGQATLVGDNRALVVTPPGAVPPAGTPYVPDNVRSPGAPTQTNATIQTAASPPPQESFGDLVRQNVFDFGI